MVFVRSASGKLFNFFFFLNKDREREREREIFRWTRKSCRERATRRRLEIVDDGLTGVFLFFSRHRFALLLLHGRRFQVPDGSRQEVFLFQQLRELFQSQLQHEEARAIRVLPGAAFQVSLLRVSLEAYLGRLQTREEQAPGHRDAHHVHRHL